MLSGKLYRQQVHALSEQYKFNQRTEKFFDFLLLCFLTGPMVAMLILFLMVAVFHG